MYGDADIDKGLEFSRDHAHDASFVWVNACNVDHRDGAYEAPVISSTAYTSQAVARLQYFVWIGLSNILHEVRTATCWKPISFELCILMTLGFCPEHMEVGRGQFDIQWRLVVPCIPFSSWSCSGN